MKTKQVESKKILACQSKALIIKSTFQGIMHLALAAYQASVQYEENSNHADAKTLALLNDLKGSAQILKEGCDHIEKLIKDEKNLKAYPQA